MNKNLSKYLAAAGAITGIASANAQIVYTDVDPDVSLTVLPDSTQFHMIDMDNGGAPDFAMMAIGNSSSGGTTGSSSYSVAGVALVGFTSNEWAATSSNIGTYSVEVLKLVNSGAAISSGMQWAASSSSLGWAAVQVTGTSSGAPLSITAGKWFGVGDGYAGVKFQLAGSTHYGWIRFGVSADGKTITVKDYAYNTQADSSITAGQLTTGVEGMAEQHVLITNSNNQVHVDIHGIQESAKFELLDLSGKLIQAEVLQDEVSRIQLNQASGVYVARVQYGEQVVTKKIYLR